MATCVTCRQPLVLEIDASDDDEEVGIGNSSAKTTVPDDVELKCGCHFHWQCLLENYNVAECPNCSTNLISDSGTSGQQILCTLHNEGGLQEDLDILPILTEETYLKAYPEERKCRAFLEFCREGDVQAVVSMLQADDEDDDEDIMSQDGPSIDILRYQDPIGDMQSGLHAAVMGNSQEIAWLLLFLASDLESQKFPPAVVQEAESLGIMRPAPMGKPDIRSLQDAHGRTAEHLAAEKGGVWLGWIGTERLSV